MKKLNGAASALLLMALVLQPTLAATAGTKAAKGATPAPQAADGQRGAAGTADRAAVVNVNDLAKVAELMPEGFFEAPRIPVPPPKPGPRDLPIPEGAQVYPDTFRPSTPARGDQLNSAVVPSPAPSASFAASPYNGWLPPDTHGAVGPNHLLVAHNGRFQVQTRSGNNIQFISLAQFWSKLMPTPADIFDPKVLYDPYGQRFIIVSCATRRSAESSVLVGVSQTSDPTGNWFVYRVDADGADATWADFPSIGFNKNWIVVHMNMFTNAEQSSFSASKLWAFDRANLYSGGNGSHTSFTLPSLGSTMVPAVTLDPNIETLHLLQNWNGNSGGNGFLRLYTITPGGAGPVINHTVTGRFISTPNPWTSSAPSVNDSTDFAPQKDSTQKIQANDSRMHSAVYRNGTLWASHTVFLPAGGVTRSAVQWWQINADAATPTVVQRGRIDDPSGTNFYAFPSIAVNKHGDALIGYARFRADAYPGAAYSYRAGSDAPGTTREEGVLRAGEDFYVNTFESRNRWGDYSATVVDPADDETMWTIQEYATPRATSQSDPLKQGRWGTWWARFGANPEPPTVQLFASLVAIPESTSSAPPIIVRRTGDLSGTSTVDYATSPGTASDASDFAAAYGTLVFGPGEGEKSFPLFLTNDRYVEPQESLTVTLSNPAGATIGPIGVATININSDDVTTGTNPVRAATFEPDFFVRQHYIDFLNRTPDAPGLAFWAGQTTGCGNADLLVCRINVSAAFFLSPEFQETGFYAIRAQRVAFARKSVEQATRLDIRQFIRDARQVGNGFVDGQAGSGAVLEANKQAYATRIVSSAEFASRFPSSQAAGQYVAALYTSAGVTPSAAETQQAVDAFNGAGGGTAGRVAAFRRVTDSASVRDAEFRTAFVLMQYFGYMRRDPDQAGYNFWLGKLNQFGGDFVRAEMVKSFITSGEYEQRFAP